MKKLLLVLALLPTLSQAQTYNYSKTYPNTTYPQGNAGSSTTYTDKYGRPTGYANSYGSTTYYADKNGNPNGSATTYSYPARGSVNPTYDPYLVTPASPIK